MKRTHTKFGFTLVELMVTIAAAAILILIAATLLIIAFQSWRTDNTYVDLRRDSAYAFMWITRDVREADYDSITDGNPLTLPAPAELSKLTPAYTWSGDSLLRSEGGGSAIPVIVNGVQNFDSGRLNDGVLVTLVLANNEFGIAITNEVFINARN